MPHLKRHHLKTAVLAIRNPKVKRLNTRSQLLIPRLDS